MHILTSCHYKKKKDDNEKESLGWSYLGELEKKNHALFSNFYSEIGEFFSQREFPVSVVVLFS